jgi:hypothetical protein
MAQAAAAAVGGASWGCAAAADVLLVLLLPLVVLYVLASHVHQLQLRCLTATWSLIRGKQKVWHTTTMLCHQPGRLDLSPSTCPLCFAECANLPGNFCCVVI